MKCLKIDNKLFESLFSDDELGVTDEQKRQMEAKEKRKASAKKAAETRKATASINKKTKEELKNDNDNKKQKSLEGFEAPKQKHSDEDIKSFSESGGKIPKHLKSSASKQKK